MNQHILLYDFSPTSQYEGLAVTHFMMSLEIILVLKVKYVRV
jgi:hypothetical protein